MLGTRGAGRSEAGLPQVTSLKYRVLKCSTGVKTTVLASELTLEKFSNRFRGADLPIEGVGVGTSFLGII